MDKKNKAKPLAKFQVKSISIGSGVGGMSCSGWHPGPDICEIKVLDDKGDEFFFSLSEADGCPCYCKTMESTFQKQVQEIDDEEFWEDLENNMVTGGCDYEEAFENCESKEEKELLPLMQFMANLLYPSGYYYDTSDVTVTTKTVNYDYGDERGKHRGSYEKLLEHNKVTHEKYRKYRISHLGNWIKHLLENDLLKDIYKLEETKVDETIDEIAKTVKKLVAEKGDSHASYMS